MRRYHQSVHTNRDTGENFNKAEFRIAAGRLPGNIRQDSPSVRFSFGVLSFGPFSVNVDHRGNSFRPPESDDNQAALPVSFGTDFRGSIIRSSSDSTFA